MRGEQERIGRRKKGGGKGKRDRKEEKEREEKEKGQGEKEGTQILGFGVFCNYICG